MTDTRALITPLAIRGEEYPATPDVRILTDRFAGVRAFTDAICEPLEIEDFVVQAMDDVSPTKWHLAHTTWFFERFVLQEFAADYQPWNPEFDFLFNSYYRTLGAMHTRTRRGQLTRPTVAEIRAYRAAIETRVVDFLTSASAETVDQVSELIVLGCHHEQQHQELILTDIKYNLSCNPLLPTYHSMSNLGVAAETAPIEWLASEAGVREIGANASDFHFDNETPRHEVLVQPHAIASRLVTNGEYLEFIADGGYERTELWLDAGFAELAETGRRRPLYWFEADGGWSQFTLAGALPLAVHEPVCHVSFFEADAFARWAGRRLPTEAEWELAAAAVPVEGNFAESGRFHVEVGAPTAPGIRQLFGDVWEWTSSPYVGYPGYQPLAGAVGEYNGKFMCNQFVLRGGSCVTPLDHVRASYRNFFPAGAQWQFSGIRLAEDRCA
jgi:ergothioneine biosynthesis protein EgtB